ncbi:uncharacterized membrane protein YhaH (DUF805 family) [Lysinibacillus sp. RC79]
MVKRTFNKLDKIQIVIAIIALLLAILGFTFDNLTKIAIILISINILVNRIRDFSKDKKSIFSYLIIVMAILIISLSINQLLS